QLRSFSGQAVEFLTAVSVQSTTRGIDENYTDRTKVTFRKLELEEIERYLEIEQPYDCAGAFKAESLGISLFQSIESTDPTALVGLPLIRLAAMLRGAGFSLP
ncbi:MAG: Maf family protein, partial [Xanthomonadales bacterium]|nr:Maf family protein [Xanthomonadales bacterium]